ncbi:MAG: hypothetical protein ABW252_06405 [Polyangiales bacterium]
MALALSAGLHVASWLALSTLHVPSLDIELTLPMDVELGGTEALTMQPAPPPEPAAPAPPSRGEGEGLDGGAVPDAAVSDAGPDDAGGDAAVAVDAGTRPRVRDAGPEIAAAAPDAGASTLPPGAQIAVRVDMRRIRESPVASDVRDLLTAIPDWHALLEGSGIDPVTQLDRLLIATPNLQREKLVLAGRYVGGEAIVRDAVARLAATRGAAPDWHVQSGVRVATWHNADATPRVIALLGPAHFAIARVEDLPRILAIAGARASRRGAPNAARQHPADALLAMGDDEGLSLEVEGVARFVRRGRRGVPERLRLAASELPGERIGLQGRFSYEEVETARDAHAYLTDLKDSYARNTLVLLLGLSTPLARAHIDQSEREVTASLELNVAQTRLILGYVREMVRPRAPPP